MADVSRETLERLGFIRYLVEEAEAQSQEPVPLSYKSVLEFHDAVEMFLLLAAEKEDVSSSHEFMAYWNDMEQQADIELTHKTPMKRLNKARVNLKHHDVKPAESYVRALPETIREFFRVNAPKVFGVDFSDVSLLFAVDYEEVRKSVERADRLKDRDLEAAIQHLAIGFEKLLRTYESSKSEEAYRSPFHFRPPLEFAETNIAGRPMGMDREHSEALEKTMRAAQSMQEAVRVMSFGLDYRKYAKFDRITPRVTSQFDQGYSTYPFRDEEISQEDFDFCRKFLIESAIKVRRVRF